ncbi:Uncharacterised protein [Sphingobacterium spiritivorum]|uniref:Uncharacterized protein n=1 Tax=Sphingobacterium spiritivorum TaxID=258 RepID=A0A380CE66_SPHSI|nr:Uncharacterised protein [Sphingobacterium spiritivorum]
MLRQITTLCFSFRKTQCTASCLSLVVLFLCTVFISINRISAFLITCRSGKPAFNPMLLSPPPVLALRLPSLGMETINPSPRFSYFNLNHSTHAFCSLLSDIQSTVRKLFFLGHSWVKLYLLMTVSAHCQEVRFIR